MNIHKEISWLLPNLGALQSTITMASFVSHDSYRKTAYRLELLPYSLGCALAAIEKARERQDEIIRTVKLRPPGTNVDYVIPDDARDCIAYELDAFIESAA